LEGLQVRDEARDQAPRVQGRQVQDEARVRGRHHREDPTTMANIRQSMQEASQIQSTM